MRSESFVRQEHEAACAAMKKLEKKGKRGMPLPQDTQSYMRLAAIKNTLEWVYPRLIKTTARGHAKRMNELMGHKHYVIGPTKAELYP